MMTIKETIGWAKIESIEITATYLTINTGPILWTILPPQ